MGFWLTSMNMHEIDVIILNMIMNPGMDGMETYKCPGDPSEAESDCRERLFEVGSDA